MEKKLPLSFEQFAKCMLTVKDDFEYFDRCYSLGVEIFNRVSSPDMVLQLLADIFDDKDGWITWFIFEKNWGKDKSLQAYEVDGKTIIPTDTLTDIYNLITK